jgi:hypothetical protein
MQHWLLASIRRTTESLLAYHNLHVGDLPVGLVLGNVSQHSAMSGCGG